MVLYNETSSTVEYNKFVATTVKYIFTLIHQSKKTINTIKIKPLTPTTSHMPEMWLSGRYDEDI